MIPDIPGLILIPDYIEEPQHNTLLGTVDSQPWLTELRRRVQHYGWRYNYRTRQVTADAFLGPLPPWLSALAQRLYADRLMETEPDQCIVNEYLPGQGIHKHIDCLPCFGATIATISLAADISFDMYHGSEMHTLRLTRRSLLIMGGPARSEWAHGIAARTFDLVGTTSFPRQRRLSLTFRTVTI